MNDPTLERYIPLADSIAGEYLACNKSLDRDDVIGEARLAMVIAAESGPSKQDVSMAGHIARQVRCHLRDLHGKIRRRAAIAPMVGIEVIGYRDGEPLISARALRSAESLNPPADMRRALREHVGRIRESALRQCCSSHPRHRGYENDAMLSRERTRRIREGFEHLRRRKQDRAAA